MIYIWNSGCINDILSEIVFLSMKQNQEREIRHCTTLFIFFIVKTDMASIFIIISVFQMATFVVLPSMIKIK